ncbi:MAG: hypothetical protein GXP16_12940 [Gammaproteobacteria bacterium]|nr:hypothetical protein [Gammaproteobacteria bacterium]
MAVFLSLILDAISDPLIGYVSDRWKLRWGTKLHNTMGSCWLFVFANLPKFFLSCYHLPHLALGSELTDDNILDRFPHARTNSIPGSTA